MAKKNVLTRGKKQQALALMQQGQPREARPLLEKICRTDRTDAEAQFMLGIVNGMLGEHEKAEKAFRQILNLFPRHPDANNNLGLSLEAQGRSEEAAKYFEKAVQLAPDNAGFLFNYANAFESLGQLRQAKQYYEKAISLQSNYTEAFCNLGNVLLAEGDYAEAVIKFQHAIELSSEFARQYPQIFLNLGNALKELNRYDEAIQAYQQAIQLRHDYVDAHIRLGVAYLELGKRESAIETMRQVLRLQPDNASAYYTLADAKRFSERDADVKDLERLYADPAISEKGKIHSAFALGKIYADLGDDARSFDYYLAANRLKRKSFQYSISEEIEHFESIKQIFTPEFFDRHSDAGINDATPIFIVGMPRSGTTLTEQILASHSQVYGAGELTLLKSAIDRVCGDDTKSTLPALTNLSDVALTAIGSDYLTRLRALAPKAPRIINKMPYNFLYLGLIRLVLPKAKIIHCRAILWIPPCPYLSRFFSLGQEYAYDLAELGQYYRLYLDLMAYWRRVLPVAFCDLGYEQLVTDQEPQTRQLLAYCDLPWEDACLEFHRTQRVVRTASLMQVRQPMHANSVEGWRRYEHQLQPFIRALAGTA